MLHEIRLEGFKSHPPGGNRLPLRELTLIFGPNSAGKSSLFQSVFAMRQSWRKVASIQELVTAGELVDLGKFGAVLHSRGARSVDHLTIGLGHRGTIFEFTWEDPDSSVAQDEGWQRRSMSSARGRLLSLVLKRPTDWDKLEDGSDRQIRFNTRDQAGRTILVLDREDFARCWPELYPRAFPPRAPSEGAYEGSPRPAAEFHVYLNDQDVVLDAPGMVEPSSPTSVLLGEIVSRYAIDASPDTEPDPALFDPHGPLLTLRELPSALPRLRAQLERSAYIGGLRQRGRRLYFPHVEDEPWWVGHDGGRMVDVILGARTLGQADVLVRTNELLAAMSLGISAEFGNSSPQLIDDARELLLRTLQLDGGEEQVTGLPDHGTGVSQLLPIVVQLAAAELGAAGDGDVVLFIEQPELHLHPAWQSRLPDLFTAVIGHSQASTVSADGTAEIVGEARRRVQLIVETHSEHVVLALANHIREDPSLSDRVQILAFEPTSSGVRVEELRFRADGEWEGRWPGGFFPERRKLHRGETP